MLRVAPAETVMIVFATLVSQVALMISLLLPLKLVILMGRGGTPRYFPEFLLVFETKTLVLALGAASIVLFLLHLITEKLVNWLAQRGSSKASQRSAKLMVLANQDEVMRSVYERVARADASLLYGAIALLAIGLLYPHMAILLAGSILAYVIFSLVFANNLNELNVYNATAQQIIFLSAVAFVIIQFFYDNMPNPIFAIISIILSRQMLGRLAVAVRDIASVIQQRAQISAFFFHKQVLHSPVSVLDLTYWPSFDAQSRNALIASVIREVTGEEHNPHRLELLDTGQHGVLAFTTFDEEDRPRYSLKVYESSRGAEWLREVNLLSCLPEGTPLIPRLLGSHDTSAHLWLVFDPIANRTDTTINRAIADEMIRTLWTIEPPKKMLNQYQRTHPMRFQRLDATLLEKLRILCQMAGMEAEYVTFSKKLPEFRKRLSQSCLVLTNHALAASLFRSGDTAVATDWSNWAIEPIGSGWPIASCDEAVIRSHLRKAAEVRRRLRTASVSDFILSAQMYSLVRSLERKRWHQALDDLRGLCGTPRVTEPAEADELDLITSESRHSRYEIAG